MKRNVRFVVVAFTLACMLVGCLPQRTVTLEELLQAEDMEEFNKYAIRAKSQGIDGIPLLLAIIDDSLESKYSVFSYGKLNTSIMHLHDLAADNVHTVESVPVLIRAIDEQIAITDTLVSADTLRMITGVNVGYDSDFVSTYKVDDEDQRQEMISAWSRWYATNSRRADP